MAILSALATIRHDGFEVLPVRSEVHAAIEERVIDECGEDVGEHMHTGRSRNDKSAMVLRIALREELVGLAVDIPDLEQVLLDRADEIAGWLVSGYTHLQNAQTTTLDHHLSAHTAAFERGAGRLVDAPGRVNENPLGSAAFGGTGFEEDRDRTTELHGFDAPMRNSMDAVASRDTTVESVAAAANAVNNLSWLYQDMVL
jgi:argininosuccinate lyase